MKDEFLLFKFIQGLTLCDHMGDVCDDVLELLKQMGYPDLDIDLSDYCYTAKQLKKRGLYHGTLWVEPDEGMRDCEDDDN